MLVTHEEDIARHARRILRFRDGELTEDEPVSTPIDARQVLASGARIPGRAAVGVFFGFYPARKASLLNPIDALRHE